MLRSGPRKRQRITELFQLRHKAFMIKLVDLLKADNIRLIVGDILKYFILARRSGIVKQKI